jgi:general secretion pathway protein A
MYESFFGFVKRPFLAASTLDRYFPATCIEQTFQTASRAIQRGEGPVAIFGGTGLGKTMCCLRVAENFRRNFEVVMLSSSQLITRRALLQSLLFELRMPYRDMTEGELRLTLMSRLQPSTDNPTDGLVLIVDEAQTMSMKLLDEIRLLTNVVRNGVPRVRLVLCGTMRLEDCLSHPHMDSLNQRLAARCYLTPLSNQETSQYVIHKIELSGVIGSSVMTRDALDAIYRGSDGIPRLIDQLADQSLLLACNERERPVSAAMVGRAWCMLQQLPNPWSEPESIVKSTSSSSLPISAPTPTITTPTGATPSSETPSMAASFELMMKGSVASSIPKHSNIEFGQLDDEFVEAESTTRDSIYESASDDSEYQATSDFEDAIARPETKSIASKNLLDVFAGDFDEEFSIPVQSSDSYQAYSGAAYGNLNYDLSNFGNSIKAPIDEGPLAFDDVSDFFSAPTPSQREVLSNNIETVSNISPEQAENLERQIEDEMRDLVSGLNMNAMTFDPTVSVAPYAQESVAFANSMQQRPVDDRRLSHHSHSEVIAFSGMHSYDSSFESENTHDRAAMDDDRDLLVIEDDLEAVRGGVSQATHDTHRAVLHPYAKLFTKLRNS